MVWCRLMLPCHAVRYVVLYMYISTAWFQIQTCEVYHPCDYLEAVPQSMHIHIHMLWGNGSEDKFIVLMFSMSYMPTNSSTCKWKSQTVRYLSRDRFWLLWSNRGNYYLSCCKIPIQRFWVSLCGHIDLCFITCYRWGGLQPLAGAAQVFVWLLQLIQSWAEGECSVHSLVRRHTRSFE